MEKLTPFKRMVDNQAAATNQEVPLFLIQEGQCTEQMSLSSVASVLPLRCPFVQFTKLKTWTLTTRAAPIPVVLFGSNTVLMCSSSTRKNLSNITAQIVV